MVLLLLVYPDDLLPEGLSDTDEDVVEEAGLLYTGAAEVLDVVETLLVLLLDEKPLLVEVLLSGLLVEMFPLWVSALRPCHVLPPPGLPEWPGFIPGPGMW